MRAYARITTPITAQHKENMATDINVKQKTVLLAALTAYVATIQRQIDKEPNEAIRKLREEDRNEAVMIKQKLQGGVL